MTFFSREALDITNSAQLTDKIGSSIDLVINAAAYTAVDRAERERAQARRVNAEGPGLLAKRCGELSIPLIHVSTDYVFGGEKGSPYVEEDEPGPLNEYGASKLAGEEAVRQQLPEHLILRTASVFSEFGQNFVKSMLRLGAERSSISVVADQTCCPTAAADIAKTIVRLVAQISSGRISDAWGTYHLCGQPPVTWFEFAREIFKTASEYGVKPKLRPIGVADYPAAAARPIYSALDCTKLERTFGIRAPAWAVRMPDVVRTIVSGA